MNVILKPAGVAAVLVAVGVLAFIAIPKKAPTPTEMVFVPESRVAGGGKRLSHKPKIVNWKNAKPIIKQDITEPNWTSDTAKGKLESKVVPSSVPEHPFARQLVISERGANPWDLRIVHPIEVALTKGRQLRLTYWGRSQEGCSLGVVVEQSSEPWTKMVERVVKLTPEWTQYTQTWEPLTDREPGWGNINFRLSYQLGEIELTGVVLEEAR